MHKDVNPENRKDAKFDHIAVIKPRDAFEGGTLQYDWDHELKGNGVYVVMGTPTADKSIKEIQRIEFGHTQFTVNQAKNWVTDKGLEAEKFIPAEENPRIDEEEEVNAAPKSIGRIDYLPDTLQDSFMVDKFTKTPEGFLTGRAIITNVGVFPYVMDDGSVRLELRPAEEVFHPDSIASLKNKVLTNDHPTVAVDADNAADLQKGFVGDTVYADGFHLSAPITITDADTVADVQAGKRGLSAGYSVDIDETSGVWMGIHYDVIQRNIRYNHTAVVERGRAGDSARMKLDSADGVPVSVQISQPTQTKEENEPMKKIKIDGVEYEAEGEVIKQLTTAQAKLDAANEAASASAKANSELQAKLDAATEELASAKTKLDEAATAAPEQVEAAVQARLDIMVSAGKAGVEVKKEDTNIEIQKAVILKASPDAKLDGKDEVYITARYDAAVERIDAQDTASQSNLETVNGLNNDELSDEHADAHLDGEQKVDKARQAYIANLANAYKTEK